MLVILQLPFSLQVGGYEAYLLADDDNEAAEVYKAVSARWDAWHWVQGGGRGRQEHLWEEAS